MYRHVPVRSVRLPLVPLVRNEKESRRRGATHIMYLCVYLDCRQPTGRGKERGRQTSFVCVPQVL
jgi:hypothetical protein